MAGLAAGLLAPLGAGWDAASRLRRALARPYRAPVPVICVGNLVAGGSGKTPVVLALAASIAARGVAIHIVTRGYGGFLGGPVPVDPARHDAKAVGDEALLLAASSPCWVARDRAAGVREAVAAGAGAILLDDGFQNPAIEKDLSLVVVDAEYGFGNGRVIPAGPLREPVAAGLARADAIVLLGDGVAPDAVHAAGCPIFRADLEPVDGERFAGVQIVAFAGIGRPGKFFASLRGVGATLTAAYPFPDHHRFADAEIARLRDEAQRADARLVTTAKDWLRLPPRLRGGIEVLEVEIHWHDEAAVAHLVGNVLPKPSAGHAVVRSPPMAPPFFPSPPPAGGEGRVRGPCNEERRSRHRSAAYEPNSVAGTPLTLPSPPVDGGRGRKKGEAARRPIGSGAALNMPDAAEAPLAPVPWSDRIEAGGAALFFAAMGALPIDAASALGGALARHIGPWLGVSKRARRNLRAALPELSAREIERVLRGMWDNLGRVAAEYPHLPRVRIFPAGGRVETSGIEHLDRAIAAGRPVIIFGGHLGNWEIAARAAGQYGIDVAQIYRAANNPLVDRMIARFRGTGSEFIPKGAIASRRALAALRRGAHLTLLVDQKLNDGIPVPFFGRPAMTAPALALLALHFDCAVLPARVERLQGAHFRLTIHPPLPLPKSGERAADVAGLMEAVNRTLETWIRERPEQWFWLHRRWPD